MDSSNLHQMALFAEAGGPSMMELSAKTTYLQERKYAGFSSNVFNINCSLITLYFVVVLYMQYGGREIFVSIL